MTQSVLIVDDSLTVRMDLSEAFEHNGFRPVLCATGAEAREAIAHESLDVAIFDLRLPDTDGINLVTELRSRPVHGDTVVVLLSSEADVRDRIRGLRTGADEYIGKPYDSGYVVARVRQLLRARAEQPDEPPSVLLIDDSVTFRESMRERLEDAGYTVVTASTGEEGLRLAADRRPHAVIVDGILPGIDGATVIRRIRLDAALRDVPCLLMTASDDYATEAQMLEAGADGFARKQDDVGIVLARLAAILRHRADILPIKPVGSVHGPTKVLAVHGDPDRLRVICDILREDAYEVVAAASGADALAMLTEQPVDCVLLALELPDTRGEETCRRIRQAPNLRDVPLIMTADRANQGAVVDCLSAGADDFVPDPDDPDALRVHVRAQIRRKQLYDESRRIREELLRRELDAAEQRAARKLAETRAALVEELQWRNRELEAFSGSVSHDLRGPLQVINGFTDALLEDELDRLSPNGQHFLRRIHAATHRMAELVEALLHLAHANRGELCAESFDLSALARQVVEDFRGRGGDQPVAFSIEDGMVAVGDVALARVVLVNLVGNAVKFTSRVPRPEVAVGAEPHDDGPAFFVRDNGAGFPQEAASRLFQPFSRLHSADEFPGTGIGLTTVRRIVDRHGGRIWAVSDVDKGATFYFTLPAPPTC